MAWAQKETSQALEALEEVLALEGREALDAQEKAQEERTPKALEWAQKEAWWQAREAREEALARQGLEVLEAQKKAQ